MVERGWPRSIHTAASHRPGPVCWERRFGQWTLLKAPWRGSGKSTSRRFPQSQPCRYLVHLLGQLTSTRRPSHLRSLFPFLESDRLSSQLLAHSCVRTFARLQTRVCEAEERCNPLIYPEVFSGVFVFH